VLGEYWHNSRDKNAYEFLLKGVQPMMRRFGNAMMALAAATSMTLAAIPDAQARHGRGAAVGAGVAAGIIGLGILGAAAAARDRPRYYSRYDDGACYRGPLECRWTGRRCFENEFGDTICRGGREICERPLICD